MMERSLFCLIILVGGVTKSVAQTPECPVKIGWMPFEDKCYKFNAYPRMAKQSASSTCLADGARLVSINSISEHQFIDRTLLEIDEARQDWLTSGTTKSDGVKWGDNTEDTTFQQWANPESNRFPNTVVILKYTGTEYKWSEGSSTKNYAFICEISLKEVNRITQELRDFTYGLDIENPALAPRGPTFITQPQNTVILGRTTAFHIDCVAKGLPEPTYEWLRMNDEGDMVPLQVIDRYTFTTGRLSVDDPRHPDDTGTYQCVAKNDYGIILSQSVTVSFGDLGEFSNVSPAPVEGFQYQGSQLECPTITGNPAIGYGWYKGNFQFIRPDFQKHTFISANGKLYFSALAPSDQDDYHCMASLTSPGDPGNYLGAYQAPSRISRSFKLTVKSGGAFNQAPIIQNEFIFIYPQTPMRGSDISLECFAYGNGDLIYSWFREGMPLPKEHTLRSNNRILTIMNAGLEDDGNYTCRVYGTDSGEEAFKSTQLLIQAKPYFTYDLTHQHLDMGSQLTWTCEASGRPSPVYTWYKNGEVLQSSPGITVNKNTLVISSLDPERDNAMYQCGATNRYGSTYSSAQLRVLRLVPSFEKSPMLKSVTSSIGGNVTLLCNPWAAPTPTYTWSKDDVNLGLTSGVFNDDDHYKVLANGNLMITRVSLADQGKYTCFVENNLGSAEDYTYLRAMEGVQITLPPADDFVEVNLPAWLTCEASNPEKVDMVYEWKFNDHIINFDREPEYRQSAGNLGPGATREGDLHIIATQFKNEGYYTCTASTALNTASGRAYLTVLGPPGEPMGVNVFTNPMEPNPDPNDPANTVNKDTSRWLMWSDSTSQYRPITFYDIEFNTAYNREWRVHPDGEDIPISATSNENFPEKRYARLTNLKAGALMSFRVRARNEYGVGPPSMPTADTKIADARPTKTVENVRGGGGSVGDLSVVWDPLPREDHNGANLRYIVKWKEYIPGGTNNDLYKWSEETVEHSKVCKNVPDFRTGLIYQCEFVYLVGADYFYMPYEVQIQTENDVGKGPTTEPTIIMSAEELPLTSPTKVYAKQFNATALMVTWDPIPNDRKNARGQLTGYKINYWRMRADKETEALQNIIELPQGASNLNEGLIIGLLPFEWYSFNVQAYNSAGNGPKSSDYDQQTYNKAPQLYPTEVHVFSIDGFGVRVNFRGISTQWREEPLIGYMVQYWKARENILSASEANFGKRTTGVIRNLTSSELYQLRVYGYSRGGQGARSSPSIFFTVGDGEIVINQETMQLENAASLLASSHVVLFLMSSLACVYAQRWRS